MPLSADIADLHDELRGQLLLDGERVVQAVEVAAVSLQRPGRRAGRGRERQKWSERIAQVRRLGAVKRDAVGAAVNGRKDVVILSRPEEDAVAGPDYRLIFEGARRPGQAQARGEIVTVRLIPRRACGAESAAFEGEDARAVLHLVNH